MSKCSKCLEKDIKIHDLTQEVNRLKKIIQSNKRKQKEGIFGSSTPSSKIPIKENTKVNNSNKNGGGKKGHKGHGRKKPTFIITNNGVYRQVKLVRKMVLGEYVLTEEHDGMDIDKPVINFKQLAESMGVKATQVTEPDDIENALKEAIDDNKPRLVEVFIENKPKA